MSINSARTFRNIFVCFQPRAADKSLTVAGLTDGVLETMLPHDIDTCSWISYLFTHEK